MQQEINISDFDMLTPGSVWVRENGKEARFLFLTNTNLPPHVSVKHPRMAVYADENDNIFSTPVADFVGKRKFFNIDPSLEARLEDLLALNDSSIDTDFSLNDDELIIAEEPDMETTYEKLLDAEVAHIEDGLNEESVREYPVEFFAGDTGLPEIISPQRLAELTESYQQQPLISENKLLHTLFIRAEKDITHANLYASFSPTRVEQNAVYTFKVRTPDGMLEVDWDAMVGIYPYVFQNVTMFQVMFSSEVNLSYDSVEDSSKEYEQSIQLQLNATEDTKVAAFRVVNDLGTPVSASNVFVGEKSGSHNPMAANVQHVGGSTTLENSYSTASITVTVE